MDLDPLGLAVGLLEPLREVLELDTLEGLVELEGDMLAATLSTGPVPEEEEEEVEEEEPPSPEEVVAVLLLPAEPEEVESLVPESESGSESEPEPVPEPLLVTEEEEPAAAPEEPSPEVLEPEPVPLLLVLPEEELLPELLPEEVEAAAGVTEGVADRVAVALGTVTWPARAFTAGSVLLVSASTTEEAGMVMLLALPGFPGLPPLTAAGLTLLVNENT